MDWNAGSLLHAHDALDLEGIAFAADSSDRSRDDSHGLIVKLGGRQLAHRRGSDDRCSRRSGRSLNNGVIGYAGLIISEAIAGMILGLFSNLALYILSYAGQIADMEIGLSMVTQFNPSSKVQVTITSNLLTFAVMLTMVATNLHLYILRAVIDSFVLIPVGKAVFSPLLYQGYLGYLVDYMVLAFRIILPVFAALMVVNTILAVLAKAAPQMNMFVIGHQLKIFIGLSVLTLMMIFLPSISEMIFEQMMKLLRTAAAYMTP